MSSFITKWPYQGILGIAGVTTPVRPIVEGGVTPIIWPDDIAETSSAKNLTLFVLDSSQFMSRQNVATDKAWREVEQFLAEWDALEATTDMDDEWLDNLRASSSGRLDELYKLDNWE